MCVCVCVYIYVIIMGYHWFRPWLEACSTPNYYLSQCWLLPQSLKRIPGIVVTRAGDKADGTPWEYPHPQLWSRLWSVIRGHWWCSQGRNYFWDSYQIWWRPRWVQSSSYSNLLTVVSVTSSIIKSPPHLNDYVQGFISRPPSPCH